MPADPARLDDASLRQISSVKTLERGRTYAASGAVTITAEDQDPSPALHACVAGTAVYRTTVRIKDGELAGNCDCASAEGGWFCKHMVAVALVWRHRLAGTEVPVDEVARRKVTASARRAATVKQRRDALHGFLHSRPAEELARKLIDLAESYSVIERELKAWQKIADAASKPEDIKKLLTDILTAPGRFLQWNESGTYARQAQAALPLLQQARERDAQGAMALGIHALRRCWTVLAKADDSSGVIGDLVRALAEEWVRALQAAGRQPRAFGDTYLRLQLDDPFGCFDTAAAEDAMGSAALQRYRELLEQGWHVAAAKARTQRERRLAANKGRTRGTGHWLQRNDAEVDAAQLERLHLAQLERQGDIDAMLRVLRDDLSSSWRFLQVSQLLEKNGRAREAFANAEAALRAFPDDLRVQDELLRCYERDGWTAEAYALRRKQYEDAPSVERFFATLTAGSAAGRDSAALRLELLNVAERKEGAFRPIPIPGRLFSAQRNLRQPQLRDVSLRAAILGSEGHWIEACALIQPPNTCHAVLAQQIALRLPATHKPDALALLQRALDETLSGESTPYRRSLELVRQIADRLPPPERTAWLANLKLRSGPRFLNTERGLDKWIPARFRRPSREAAVQSI